MIFRLVWELRLVSFMKLWQRHDVTTEPRRSNSRHEFVIGPLCDNNLSSGKARLYYCRLCKWSFLVCGNKVAVLDADGEPLACAESIRQFSTFEAGPCPVLEAFASVALTGLDKSRPSIRSKYDERNDLAPNHLSARPDRPQPLLRILTGMRENLGRRA